MSLFHLSDAFIGQFVGRQPKWGPIGYVTYKRTYARDLDKVYERHQALGLKHDLIKNEEFWLTLVRVTEGTFGILRDHCRSLRLPWDDARAHEMAQDMFQLMWDFKFLPPGRGLWMMGTPAVAKIGGACLNNCGFQSSENIDVDFSAPFVALMDFSMLGVGVGGDARGAGKVRIQKPDIGYDVHVVEDTREGWVSLLKRTLDAFVGIGSLPGNIDDSGVRQAGEPIKGFGGTASGPAPLREMIDSVSRLLYSHIGELVTSDIIVDIFNMIGKCVVAGNVRRSAEIMFGDPADEGFLELKDRDKHAAALDGWRWASNNSVFAKVGQRYGSVAKRTAKNGEPGYYWLGNAQAYGRMIDPPDHKDRDAKGGNPCVTADTLVMTTEGPRRVDQLLGRPFKAVVNGDVADCRKGFFSTGHKPVFDLCTVEGFTVRLTSDHKVLVKDGTGTRWVEAGALSAGDEVVLSPEQGTARFDQLKPAGDADVYDCTVDGLHAFSANGIVVHNCLEQTLFDGELCNLVETFPFHHDNVKDYLRTLKFAYLYAKTVTLVPTHNAKTNAVTMKNRRIGCSQSGIIQAMQKFGRRAYLDMCDKAYAYVAELDKEYSGWLCVPESIKKTSVKPSGTVSLLPQATPGIHHPIAECYWRVIRFATDSHMLPALRAAGYRCVDIDPAREPNTTAVYFPVREEGFERGERDVSMWEQLELAAALQAHWADNQVSVTIKFDKKTEGPQIARALELYETRLKGVSFLPHDDHGYDHAPYQPISVDEYEAAVVSLRPLDLSAINHEVTDAFCDGDKCVYSGARA